MKVSVKRAGWLAAVLIASVASSAARADMSAEELAKLAQNPVGNLISLPFQNNTNFNVGPLNGTQAAITTLWIPTTGRTGNCESRSN